MKNKKLFLTLLLVLCSGIMMAQAPQAMTLQAVVRTPQGDLAVSQNVSLQISILQGSANGSAVYVENLSGKTNANGLITLKLGEGMPQTGSFADIDWAHGPYFVNVAVDVTGGLNFITQSTTQLLSVPYAMYAVTAGELAEPVSYNDLVDIPENIGFSGNYQDLTGAPELAEVATSGDYADLSGTPELADVALSGSYADLSGKPQLAAVATTGNYKDLADTPGLAAVATSGSYNDLQNKPSFATVAVSGDYNDLTNRPVIPQPFSGNYQDLTGAPDIHDSIARYGFSGDYNRLSNVPDFADVAFSGDFNDLRNIPSSDGTITDYHSLYNLPNFKDSVEQYAVLDYNQLTNRPSIVDTVRVYGFSGDYNDLINRPNLSDDGTFSGDYHDLINLPNLKDTVEKYAPETATAGVHWDNVEGRPEGSNDGDLLYWENDQWNILPIGAEGQFLAVADGKLTWMDPDWANRSAETYEVGDIFFNASGEAEGVVFEVSSVGRYAKIVALHDADLAEWDPLGVEGCWEPSFSGPKPVAAGTVDENNGLDNTTVVKNIPGWIHAYPAFANCADKGDSWYLPAREEMKNIAGSLDVINHCLAGIEGADSILSPVYWTSTESDMYFAYAVAVTADYTQTVEGEQIVVPKGDAFEQFKAFTGAVRPARRLSWAEATSKDVNAHLYKTGDLYIWDGDTIGVVYRTKVGGLHGQVIAFRQDSIAWENVADTISAGWMLPSSDEWTAISARLTDINAMLINAGQLPIDETDAYWTSDEDAENETNAYVYDITTGDTPSLPKTDKKFARYILEF